MDLPPDFRGKLKSGALEFEIDYNHQLLYHPKSACFPEELSSAWENRSN